MGPGTANVPQAQGGFKKNSWSKLRSGASSHCHRSADWQSAVSRIGNRLAIRPPAEYHSAKSRCIGTSLHYKPAPIRIGGSAKMPPLRPVRRRVKLGAWLQSPAEQGTYVTYVTMQPCNCTGLAVEPAQLVLFRDVKQAQDMHGDDQQIKTHETPKGLGAEHGEEFAH